MMKKESEISSGAEKVERVEKFTQEGVDSAKTPTEKTEKEAPMPQSKGKTAKKTAEEKAAKERVDAARSRAKKKETAKKEKLSKREEKKKRAASKREKRREERENSIAEKKKRALERKERKAEARAAKLARRELLKNETKADRMKRLEREKRERIALRRKREETLEKEREERLKAREAAHVRKREAKKHRREQRSERRREGGYGGWLAAVISLGTACLILGGVVTAGAFRMNEMSLEMDSAALSSVYEMVGLGEDLGDRLGKLRVVSGAWEQRRLLTDVVVDSALLEAAVEKMPLGNEAGADISAFVNRIRAYAGELLKKLAAGGTLSEEDRARIEELYEESSGLHQELNALAGSAQDAKKLLSGGMEKMLSEKKKDMRSGEEAPFAQEGNIGKNRLADLEEVSSSEALELCKEYFSAYHIAEVRYTGETVTPEMSLYDFELLDEEGLGFVARLTKRGGKLAFFDTYEECTTKNFDLRDADALAREFLAKLGIEDVEAVWLSDGGMVANLTYTTVEDGVRIYPETIRVRVCEEKGRVIGIDARTYLVNDKTYDTSHSLTAEEAEARLSEGLVPYSVHLALIPVEGKEVVAYEFGCTYGEEEYIVYLDASSGEEVCVYRVVASARGSYLR